MKKKIKYKFEDKLLNKIPLAITYSCSNKNGMNSVAERAQGILTFALGAVTMDTGCRVTFSVEEIFQAVSTFLGLHKHQGERIRTCERKVIKLVTNWDLKLQAFHMWPVVWKDTDLFPKMRFLRHSRAENESFKMCQIWDDTKEGYDKNVTVCLIIVFVSTTLFCLYLNT